MFFYFQYMCVKPNQNGKFLIQNCFLDIIKIIPGKL